MSLCSSQASRMAATTRMRCTMQCCSRRHSHVGARPIPIPSDVVCTFHKSSATASAASEETMLRFSGPLGVRELRMPAGISPILQSASQSTEEKVTAGTVTSKESAAGSPSNTTSCLVMQCRDPSSADIRSSWGLAAALAHNCVQGVHKGFDVNLQLVGVGYRASIEDQDVKIGAEQGSSKSQTLVLRLGYPRPLRIPIPTGMQCQVSSPTQIKLTGNDKASLAQLAAKIRSLRPPEPYNGKGVFVDNETIQRKEVKKK